MDHTRLCVALETGGFELMNSQVHQNLVLHHIGGSMYESVVFLRELVHMAGSSYRPYNLREVSLRDIQWLEIARVEEPVF